MEHDDIEIVRQYLDNNLKDFSTLYERFYQSVYFKVRYYLKDDFDAEDVTQNIFIVVYNEIQKLEDPSKFNSWLNRIIYHDCMDVIRSTKYKQQRQHTEYNDEIHVRNNKKDIPLELHDIIRDELNQYEEEIQSMVLLKYYDGFTNSEIANIMNISESNVKVRLHRIKKEMQASLSRKNLSYNTLFGTSLAPILFSYFRTEYFSTTNEYSSQFNGTMVAQYIAEHATGSGMVRSILTSTVGVVTVLTGSLVGVNTVQAVHIENIEVQKNYKNTYETAIRIHTDCKTSCEVVLPTVRAGDKNYQVIYEDDGYTVYVDHNDVYQVEIESAIYEHQKETVAVNSIDDISPTVQNVSLLRDGKITGEVVDTSEINWQNSYAMFEGTSYRIMPKSNTEFEIELEKVSDGFIYIEDVYGNATRYIMNYE